MTDLKPCPFCGGSAVIEDHRLIFIAKCQACEVSMLGDRADEPDTQEDCDAIDFNELEKTAIDKWNARCDDNE